ncbi:MAG: class I SAM-dependent methyltransferase, partial [Methyloligellaceae bacterium]
GPGTGVFTRALIRRGIPEEQLILVEAGESFATLLKQRYPKATVLQQDAASFWKYHRRENQKIGAIISGLPLLSMTTRKVAGVLKNITSNMVPGGAFYQFTYGLKVPVSKRVLQKMGLAYSRLGGTLGNFPPASVYRIYNEKYHVSESINYRNNGLITVTV